MSGGPLSLPERIVHAAEQAVIEASAAKRETELRGVESVEGFPHDFAKAALSAALEEWANELAEGRYVFAAWERRDLAQAVRDVPAVKAV